MGFSGRSKNWEGATMPNSAPAPQLKMPVTERDHIAGPPEAKVTMVEFGDYQCPHCKAALPVIAKLREKFGEQLRLVYRHFPLVKLHPEARLAAEAAEAAGAQGKFWELHALLFQHQQELEPEHLVVYASEIGLDEARFVADLNAHTYEARVREDLATGLRSGVNGTPTFFINGFRHNGGYALEGLVKAIEAALAAAE
jgi:protein-disulfide isomerase